jgi:hypothetical protein
MKVWKVVGGIFRPRNSLSPVKPDDCDDELTRKFIERLKKYQGDKL